MMENGGHPESALSEALRENLHRHEALCSEMTALCGRMDCDFKAEIARLEAEFAAAPALPPEYAELLEKEFAKAKDAALAGAEQAAGLRKTGETLAAELDALLAAGDLATLKETEALQKRFDAYAKTVSALPECLKDFAAKLAPVSERLNAEAAAEAAEAASADALLVEFEALCSAGDAAKLQERKAAIESALAEFKRLPADRQKRIQELHRKASTLLAQHFETLDFARWESYTLKLDLCTQLEQLLELPAAELFKAAKPLGQIREKWKTLGAVPREKNEEINARYLELTRTLQRRVDEFFSNRRQEQKGAAGAKTELCVKAEALAETTHWNDGTAAFKDLQAQWKALPACGAGEEALFKRFRAAADKFFAARSEYFTARDARFKQAAEAKLALIAEAEQLSDPKQGRQLRERFRELPSAGKQEKELYTRFCAAMDKFFNCLREAGAQRGTKARELVTELEQLAANPAGAAARAEAIREELRTLSCRNTFDAEKAAWRKFQQAQNAERRNSLLGRFELYKTAALELARTVASGGEIADAAVLAAFPKLQHVAELYASDDPKKAEKLAKLAASARNEQRRIIDELQGAKAGVPQGEQSLAAELEAAILGNFAKHEAQAVYRAADPVKLLGEFLGCGVYDPAAQESAFNEFSAALKAALERK